ncbi:MAG: hypothetical protein LQ342_007289 [Letrouitia transgressa]|nr:MAG: hypothetical protein LQ342_007289 [Letrouitia transgressa]
MEKWRTRGYVPDSDEEQDSIESTATKSTNQLHSPNDLPQFNEAKIPSQHYDEPKVRATDNPQPDLRIQETHQGGKGSQNKCSNGLQQKFLTNGGLDGPQEVQDRIRKDYEREGSIRNEASSNILQEVDELQQDHYPPLQATSNTVVLPIESSTLPQSSYQSSQSGPSSDSIPSSPLTPPPLDTPNLLLSVASRASSIHNGEATNNWSTSELQDQSQQQHLGELSSLLDRPTRTLRQRRPIQLHPYALEGEKYRQILQARGVKPIRITQTGPQRPLGGQDESQEQDFSSDNRTQESLGEAVESLPTSPSLALAATSIHHPQAHDDMDIDDGELPDINALFRGVPMDGGTHTRKRRKVIYKSKRKDEIGSAQKDRPSFIHPGRFLRDRADQQSLADILPSPPFSGSTTSLDRPRRSSNGLRMVRSHSLITLPTPTTSSEPRKGSMKEPFTIEVSEDAMSDGSSAQSLSSKSEETEVETRQLEKAQRKIRGVLPASWLKLDLKSRRRKTSETFMSHRSRSPEEALVQKGVARPLTRRTTGNEAAGQTLAVELSDMSSSETEFSAPHISHDVNAERYETQAPYHDNDNRDTLPASIWGEAEEDNAVDAMLPLGHRHRTFSKKRRKRQTKLTDPIKRRALTTCQTTINPLCDEATQPGIIDPLRRPSHPKTKFRPPNLSILDASYAEDTGVIPSFLRVARRTARSRKDRSKDSPSRKVLRLHTDLDTQHANETLNAWRAGTLKAASTLQLPQLPRSVATNRSPLKPRSSNSQPPRVPSVLAIDSPHDMKKSHHQIQSCVAHRRSKNVQTSLDQLVQRSFLKNEQNQKFRTKHLRGKGPAQPRSKQGHIISAMNPNEYRPALLESLQDSDDRRHPQAAFHRQLADVNNGEFLRGVNPVLARYLEELNSSKKPPGRQGTNQNTIAGQGNLDRATKAYNKRLRKGQPQQLNVQLFPHHDLLTDEVVETDPRDLGKIQSNGSTQAHALTGLGPFGTSYTETFAITPFPIGTHFHQSTFLGSGRFSRCLRDVPLDSPRGFSFIKIQQKSFKWGPWNDPVSEEMGQLFEIINQGISSWPVTELNSVSRLGVDEPSHILGAFVEYISSHLSFLDPIDRVSFIRKSRASVMSVLQNLDDKFIAVGRNNSLYSDQDGLKDQIIQATTLCMSVAGRLNSISAHPIIPQGIKNEIETFVKTAAQRLITYAATGGFNKLSNCFESFKSPGSCEDGIRTNHSYAQAIVVAALVLEDRCLISAFWEVIQKVLMPSLHPMLYQATTLETYWRRLFTLLPFLEFDFQGVLEPNRRFKTPFDSWKCVKQLLHPALNTYVANPSGQSAVFNVYCRTLFGRSLHLIQCWGWHRCESIIGTLFDFFARNDLANLRNEESRGSPAFLQHLDGEVNLELAHEDRCFQILLKIIAVGLKKMRQHYPEKKVRDITWRLMPNHGRFLPKDKAIRQEDLDALRNHHDLLCTLYWASPPKCRPKASAIQALVDIENSHREACHITIRAWLNLVKFQLSTKEEALEPFAEWICILLKQVISQHGAARFEMEEQVKAAETHNACVISWSLLESTIAKNQLQIEGILSDGLLSLTVAVDAAQSPEVAKTLFTPEVSRVIDLFSPTTSQTSKVIEQALDAIRSFCKKSTTDDRRQTANSCNDESQDYGDWSFFDETPTEQSSAVIALHLEKHFQEPMRQLRSNYFGADIAPADTVLTKAIDVEIAMAKVFVQNGSKTWSDYVGQYGPESWSSLRNTEQTRRFGCYYMARLVEADQGVYEDSKFVFLSTWLNSLAEREALIKYQHFLTSALLNAAPYDPILRNLPFSPKAGRIDITFTELVECRVLLISCILANIHETVERGWIDGNSSTTTLRSEFKEMLQSLMNTMKHNYQEVDQGQNACGAYVNFVHQVVEFLQQYTSAICPIDRFFTASSAFPLPATDPTYVVSQLKSYGLRLEDPKTLKQLAVFIQSVSERAAVDGQQDYLVGQLHAAMSDTIHCDRGGKQNLATFLINEIFPAYIDSAFKTACGWLLATPMLQAVRRVFAQLLQEVNGADTKSVKSILNMITSYTASVYNLLKLLVSELDHLDQRKTLKTLAECYSTITAALPVLDYLSLLSKAEHTSSYRVAYFKSFAISSANFLLGQNDAITAPLDLPSLDLDEDHHLPPNEVRAFAAKELAEALNRNWICHGNNYYVLRGQIRREVVVDVGLWEEEKAGLIAEFECFFGVLARMTVLGGDDENGDHGVSEGKLSVEGLDIGTLVF